MLFKDIPVMADERVDDLQVNNLFVLQKKKGYCFSSDAVLLANFVKSTEKDVVVDFCSGSGVVGILVAGKQAVKKLYLVEVQNDYAEMSSRSLAICNLSDKSSVLAMPVQSAHEIISPGSVNIVCVNPPYSKLGDGKITENKSIALARYEVAVTLEEIIAEASKILKFGGEFYMVNQVERLAETFFLLDKYKMPAKELVMVYPKQDKNSTVFLVKAKLGAKSHLVVKPPLISDQIGHF